jgi:hypothetical protein
MDIPRNEERKNLPRTITNGRRREGKEQGRRELKTLHPTPFTLSSVRGFFSSSVKIIF